MQVTKIDNEAGVTRDDILNEAKLIKKKVFGGRNLAPLPAELAKKTYYQIVESHRSFAQSYAITLKYMIYAGMYSHAAFDVYLRRVEKKPWTNEDSFLRSQASYVGILYQALRGCRDKDRKRIVQLTYTQLKNEHDSFVTTYKQINEDVDAHFKQLEAENRREFANFLAEIGPESINQHASTVRLVVDDELL